MFSFSCVLRFISVRASLSVLFDMYLMYYITFFRGFFRHCCVLRIKVSSTLHCERGHWWKVQGDYCPAVKIFTMKSWTEPCLVCRPCSLATLCVASVPLPIACHSVIAISEGSVVKYSARFCNCLSSNLLSKHFFALNFSIRLLWSLILNFLVNLMLPLSRISSGVTTLQ